MSDVVIIDDEMEQPGEEILAKTNEELAESHKTRGNAMYKTKLYSDALRCYAKAIELCPTSANYLCNRSACYMMLNKFQDALEDARRAAAVEPTLLKAHLRIAKCGIAMGDLAQAEQGLARARELDPNDASVIQETANLKKLEQLMVEVNKAMDKKDHRKVVYCMDRCLELAPTCNSFKLLKAECLAFLGRYEEAEQIVNFILHMDKSIPEAVYVRGLCLYYQDNMEKAFLHFQHALRLAPDHKKVLVAYKLARSLNQTKEKGNAAFKAGNLKEALALYSAALEIDPMNRLTNAKLYFNRATVHSKLSQYTEAVLDCSRALEQDEKYLKALLRRAKCYMELSKYDEAVKDYEKALKMEPSSDTKRMLNHAKLELKKSKRKDYYKILGIERNASTDEIKKAYRKRAMIHHPDRHAHASDVEKKEQEKCFKEVGEAYGILSDPKKKARYDSGQDLEDAEGGMHDIDPTQIFQTFFGCSNGPEFTFHPGSFPGGFAYQFS